MDGEAVSATVGVLVQNLITVSKDEILLVRGLEKNAEKLKETLATIQNSLEDSWKKFVTDDAVKRWLRDLEAAAFDADNVLDELNYKLLCKKMKSIRTPKKKKASCCPSFKRYVNRREMALTIMKINESFESIDNRATKLGLERRLADAPAAPPEAATETDSFTADPIFIGRDDDVSKIVEMLTTPTEQALSILPIVGMGGLGKTTLVRKVFNHNRTKAFFDLHIWVHVSQIFDPVALLKKILKNLQEGNIGDESREVVLKKLREALKAKKCVLVLDDVWNQDRHKWEDFMNSWSGITSTKGNCILVTTRNTKVGLIVNTLGIHHLNGLSDEECWSIIKDKACKGGDIQLEIETVGKSIAERCQGLPLAANVVGVVLRDKPQDKWLSIEEDWLSDVEGDESNISRILRLSYDHLSSPSLKKCFAYFSLFPKGSWVEREELIELWMAEGFLKPSQTSDDIGNKFVDLLVQSSLLQVMDRDVYNNEQLSMHDLVHDVATSVLGFPSVKGNASDDIHKARYIWWDGDADESSCISKEETKWLRTLFYLGEISDIMFSDFKSLHVLVLINNQTELSDSIRELIHLRCLNISDTLITTLPDWVGELYHLQTFRACIEGLEKLPITLKYLLNLRHLHVLEETKLPPQLGKLTSLQTLSYFNVRDEDGHRIEELGSLKNLKGKLNVGSLEKVQGEDESKKACLFQKSGIVRLTLRWDESIEGATKDESVLKGLQPPPSLKFLEIVGFKGESFPSWTLTMEGLNTLMEMRLEKCTKCKEIPMLGHLPHLKFLYLSNLENVETISCLFYNIGNCRSIRGVFEETIEVFPALEKLELLHMPNLREWVEVEAPSGAQVKVFPCLEYLSIKHCKLLRSAPTQFPCLKVLEIEEMDSGIPLTNICGAKLTTLETFNICGVGEMVCLPPFLFHNNQNLSTVDIDSCHVLRELPDGLHTLDSLEELKILHCESLESSSFLSGPQSQGFTALNCLAIECTTGFNIPCEILESCALSLEKLQLLECPMDTMPRVIEHVQKMDRLAELYLIDVSKFIISSPTELASLRSLNTLLFYPDDTWDSVSLNKAVDGILILGSASLQTVILKGKEDSECIPDQVQHLTALSVLWIDNFGLEVFPEWFRNLSSLYELGLHYCRKLKLQSFVEIMQHLTNITDLNILGCPLLKEGGIELLIDVPNIKIG